MSCEWMTPAQAAKYVGVTPSAVYRWMNKGKLKYVQTPGGGIRVCKADLVYHPLTGEQFSHDAG